MAKVLMSKKGQTDISVDSASVAFHRMLGWVEAEGEMEFNGGDMELAANPVLGSGTIESLLLRHYQLAPAALSATAVHAAILLGAAAQEISTEISNPDYPRTLTIKGNEAGIVADVVIEGENVLGEAISDVIALDGTDEIEGIVAFKSVSKITVPARTHTATPQAETATAVGTITGNGNASVVVTAAGMTGTPKTIDVAVLSSDVASAWAAKVRTALGLDAAVIALFTVGGTGAEITLTRKTAADDDASLNIALDNGTCTGITTAASSVDTTAGVAADTVSIGIGKKFGLPHSVAYAALLLVKLFNGSTDSGTLAVDADEIEKNLFALDGTPDGEKLVDLYYLA